jgi:hypothetical protein
MDMTVSHRQTLWLATLLALRVSGIQIPDLGFGHFQAKIFAESSAKIS